MNIIPPHRLYHIMTNAPYFYTGHLSDGTQMLMGVQPPDFVGIVFDVAGDYLKTSLKKINQGQEPTDEDQDEADSEFSKLIHEWQAELGVTPGTISVKQFYLPERFIGITDLPEHYQEALDHPKNFTQERLQELQGDIEAWLGSGEFVLDWDEDYYMSEEGDLNST